MAVTLDNTANANSLISNMICEAGVAEVADSLRFQSSFMCSFYTNKAITDGCPIPETLAAQQPKGPLLCPTQCNLAVSSLTNILNNKAICSNGTNFPISIYTDYCNALPANIQQNKMTCNNGSTVDVNFCGKKPTQ